MENEFLETIESADLDDDLKASLGRLVEAVQALEPELPRLKAWRLGDLLQHLVAETTDEDTEVHWWELCLDLIIKWSAGHGELGEQAAEAAKATRTLLRDSMGPYDTVTLEEISMDTVRGICLLSDTLVEPQRSMVADNAYSLAQAHFHPHAWFRAIYAGKAPVGFLMIVDDDEEPEYFVWRMMVAEPYQGRGYGRQAMERLIEYIRTRPEATELGVSCVPGEDGPEGFYVKMGFESSGVIDEGELYLTLTL